MSNYSSIKYETVTTAINSVASIDYDNLLNKPVLFDGDYNSLTNAPTLFDGDYNSLTNAPTISKTVQLNQAGTLELTTGTIRWIAPNNINISSTRLTVGTSPAGSSLIATLNKNGTVIDTLTIAAGSSSDVNSGLSLAVSSGDYLTVDITQVGSTTAGSDLNLIVEYTEG